MNELQLQNTLRGAAAGFAATAPMTAAMFALHDALPRREQHALPPRRITDEALQVASLDDNLLEPHKRALAYAAHFSYGAAVGAGFSLLPARFVRQRPVTAGVLYGLSVWAASYLGLLPAVGSDASAHRQTPRRNWLMVASHVVWGASLGAVYKQLGRM
jgi:uncharacterized membrane protein YagU involved in acid resistance